MLFHYANPAHFLRLVRFLSPFLGGLTLICMGIGLYGALVSSPPDYQQKDSVRLMYLHVPAAWMGLFVYGFMAVCSFCSLVWRHHLADVLARQSALLGAVFTFICLATGAVWGKPTWGTWWQWDARLTSMLILFFLYVGYMAIWKMVTPVRRAAQIAAVVCLMGAVDLPIIHYSVEWWNTLHQGASVFRSDGPSIHITMLWPLLTMAAGFHCLFFYLLHIRAEALFLTTKADALLERRLRENERVS